ncbi:hypothetical protein BsWGS_26395 [Bradybaena similaris]
MSENSQRCSSETEGLILSSFQVLQDGRNPHDEVRQHLKLNCPFLTDQDVLGASQNQVAPPSHVCVTEAAEGDEMFDVADNDQYRGDEVGDSLDNTTNNSIDREDDGDDEEDDEDDEDEDGNVSIRRNRLQRISSPKEIVAAKANVGSLACAPSVSDLRTHCCPQTGFDQFTPGLESHGFLDATQAVWHTDSSTTAAGSRYQSDWHMALSSTSGEVLDNRILSAPLSPGDGRERDAGQQHWKFVHGPAAGQQLWAGDDGAAKVVVAGAGPISQSWGPHKQEVVDDRQQNVHHHVGLDPSTGHWNSHLRPGPPQVHGWHQEIGGVITPEEDMNAVRSLFNLQAAANGISAPVGSHSYSDLACANTGTWSISSHLPSGSGLHHDLTCSRVTPAACYHQGPTPSYAASFPSQGREGWPQTGLPVDGSGEHYKMADVQSSMVCKSAILNKRAKVGASKCRLGVAASGLPGRSRSALDQARHQTHPYQMKEQKKIMRDVYPATSANVHTLKASHIVSWYIDYLIHENEHLTQISRAFSLPVNLFLSDDFYFMDSLKKKVHFPSLKFLSWMQQNLPSINVNAIDFHEGRPPVVSTCNQDWFWQNKSRRDIIHDVFFYFQHRRVTCEN